MSDQRVPGDPESFLDPAFALPPLPEVMRRLRRIVESGDATAGQVAETLSADPTLTSQTLAMVNSAYHGLPRQVSDLRHGVAYLGTSEIYRLALTASVMTTLTPTGGDYLDRFRFHGFYTALVARLLARKFERTLNPEPLHAAAVLHDVGKLVYARFFPRYFDTLSDYSARESVRFRDAEQHFGYPSHESLGTVLCRRWGLPGSVTRACESHELEHLEAHNRGEILDDCTRIVCVANLLCNLPSADTDYKTRIHDAAVPALGCASDSFLLLMGEVYELKECAASSLQGSRSVRPAASGNNRPDGR